MELNLERNMENEILAGMDSPISRQRLGNIMSAAENVQSTQLEVDDVRTGVSDAVKSLEKETRQMFPDKKEVAQATNLEEEKDSKNKEVKTVVVEKRILGMKPLVFTIVVIAVAVGGYIAYRNYKKAA